MQISANGIAVIKYFEGLELKVYPDPATGGAPWTIGYGHTGPEVKPGVSWSKEMAERVLLKDLNKFETGVSALLRVPVTQGQFDGLVCFAFNLGIGALQSSTLLAMVNARDFDGAAEQFRRWNKARVKGVLTPMKGLTRRRAAEQCLFVGMGGASAIERGVAAA